LQAAIDKLEALKAASTQGAWDFESLPETGESRIHSEADGFAFMAATTVTFYPVPGGMKPKDAELVVTLHRTIDAQLSLLREARDYSTDWAKAHEKHQGHHPARIYRKELILAAAILGAVS
jgi:hypothetical protein